jgi:hypothetical protein
MPRQDSHRIAVSLVMAVASCQTDALGMTMGHTAGTTDGATAGAATGTTGTTSESPTSMPPTSEPPTSDTGSSGATTSDTMSCVPEWERCDTPDDENCDLGPGCTGVQHSAPLVFGGTSYPTSLVAGPEFMYLGGRATQITVKGQLIVPTDEDGLNEGFIVGWPHAGRDDYRAFKVPQLDTDQEETVVDVSVAPDGHVYALVVATPDGADRVFHLTPDLANVVASDTLPDMFSAYRGTLNHPETPFAYYAVGICTDSSALCVAHWFEPDLNGQETLSHADLPGILASVTIVAAPSGHLYLGGSEYQSHAFIYEVSDLGGRSSQMITGPDDGQTYIISAMTWDDHTDTLVAAGVVSGSGIAGLTASTSDSAVCPEGMACPELTDFFVARYDGLSAGASRAIRSKASPTADSKEVPAVAVDGAGYVHLLGKSDGSVQVGELVIREQPAPARQAFAVKLDPTTLDPAWGQAAESVEFSTATAITTSVEGSVVVLDFDPMLPIEFAGYTLSECEGGCTTIVLPLSP